MTPYFFSSFILSHWLYPSYIYMCVWRADSSLLGNLETGNCTAAVMCLQYHELPLVCKGQQAKAPRPLVYTPICSPGVALGNKKQYFSLLELKAGEEFPNVVHICPQSMLYEGLLFQVPRGGVVLHLSTSCQ